MDVILGSNMKLSIDLVFLVAIPRNQLPTHESTYPENRYKLAINTPPTRSVYESYPQRQIATDCLTTKATNAVRHRYCNRKP